MHTVVLTACQGIGVMQISKHAEFAATVCLGVSVCLGVLVGRLSVCVWETSTAELMQKQTHNLPLSLSTIGMPGPACLIVKC